MKFYKQFLILSRGKQIAIVVCCIHLFAIFGLLGHHLVSRRLKPPRPMIVKTISAVPPKINAERNPGVPNEAQGKKMQNAKVESPAPKVQAVAPKPQKEVPKPKPATTAKKAVAAKPKPGPVAQKAPPVKEEHIFKEIAESLETLSSEAKRSRPSLTLPSKIGQKAQIAPETNLDPTYGEYLIAYLQNALDLPEYGEVRAKIEIDRFGRLIDCEILETKSMKNAEFLKNQLPELTFPCLNDFGIVDTSETFTITFRNVEIH